MNLFVIRHSSFVPDLRRDSASLRIMGSLLCVLCAFVVMPGLAQAATRTWDGDGGDGDWYNQLNWSNDTRPTFNDDAIIPAGERTITSSGYAQCKTLTIQTGATITLTQTIAGISIAGTTDISYGHLIALNTTISCSGNVLVGGAGETQTGILELRSQTTLKFNCPSAGAYGLIVDAFGTLTATGSVGTTNCKITSVVTTKRGYIYLKAESQATFQYCDFAYLGIGEEYKNGISAYDVNGAQSGEGLAIQDCSFHGSMYDDSIIFLVRCSYATVISNTVYNTGYGIGLGDSCNNIISGNTVYNNLYHGIGLYGHVYEPFDNPCDNNTISDNIVYDNQYYGGIYLESATGCTLTNNNCYDSGGFAQGYGIYLTSSANNNILTNNTCTNNSFVGIILESSNGCTLTNNACCNISSANQYSGIYFWSASDNKLDGNTCATNTGAGIYIESSSNDNNLTNNKCYTNGSGDVDSGIYLASSSGCVLTNNTCYNSVGSTEQDYGIYLDNAAANTLDGNTCSTNTQFGFYAGPAGTTGDLNLSNETYYGNTTGHMQIEITGNRTFDGCSFYDTILPLPFDVWVNIGDGNTLMMTNYTIDHPAGSKDGGTSGTVVWPVYTAWTGGAAGDSHNWNNFGNWDKGLPDAVTDAIIPAGAWVITLTNAGTCLNLTINSGGQVILQSDSLSYGLTINGATNVIAANSLLVIAPDTAITCPGN